MITVDVRYFILYFITVCFIHFFFMIVLRKKYAKFFQSFLKYKLTKLHPIVVYFFERRFNFKISKLQLFNVCSIFFTACSITFLTRLFVSCSLQTSKTLIDISSIITSFPQLLESKKQWCIFRTDEVSKERES